MLTRFSSSKLNKIMDERGISPYEIQSTITIMIHEGKPLSKLTAASIYIYKRSEQQPRADKLASMALALGVGIEDLME